MARHEYICFKGHSQIKEYPLGKKPASLECHCGKRAIRKINVPIPMFKGGGFTKTLFDPQEAGE